MQEWMDFLSADIPGGVFLLFFALVVANLSLLFLRSSGLFTKEKLKRNLLTANAVILLLYTALWFVMQPPRPQERVIVLPTRSESSFQLTPSSLKLAQIFERAAINNLTDRYLFHRWEWLYETLGQKEAQTYENWIKAARALNCRYLIESELRSSGKILIRIADVKKDDSSTFTLFNDDRFEQVLNKVDDELGLFANPPVVVEKADTVLIAARLALIDGDFQQVLKLLKDRQDVPAKVLKGVVYIKKGLARPFDAEKAKYVKIEIPEFDQAKKILVPVIKQRKDTPELDIWFGRMSIREREYTTAELFLKKAYVEDPENARVYFAFSFLRPDRLSDIGYQSRVAVLERATYFDPGYREAVYQLANEIYLSSSGTLAGSREAIAAIREFLKIKPEDPQMLSLLGSLYIKTRYPDKALPIFEKLQKRFPDDSDSYYNLGVCYYLKKQDSTALAYFMKAIRMDHHLDSYLYVGSIYKRMGKLDSALKYFRERVARKTGDDDRYAIEAMQGIRQTLIQIEENKRAKQGASSVVR